MVGVFHRAAAAVALGALVLFGAHAAVGVHNRNNCVRWALQNINTTTVHTQ